MPMRGRRLMAGLAALAMSWPVLASAQTTPDTENGRFTLSPVSDGFVRLDTRTGVVSTCTNKNGWVCRIVPDERAALDAEIGRLQADNRRLKDELAQRDTVSGKTDAPLAKEDSKKSAEAAPDKQGQPRGKIELQLPPEHEKLLALIDRVWDQLIEMANRLQKKLSDKI
ncbi:MAG: hypothetical protein BGN84_18325 [Afipia sp. 62-7]|nr:MAG: hypothetical protein BGN84_18325 [Afipia sp. 62-7]